MKHNLGRGGRKKQREQASTNDSEYSVYKIVDVCGFGGGDAQCMHSRLACDGERDEDDEKGGEDTVRSFNDCIALGLNFEYQK